MAKISYTKYTFCPPQIGPQEFGEMKKILSENPYSEIFPSLADIEIRELQGISSSYKGLLWEIGRFLLLLIPAYYIMKNRFEDIALAIEVLVIILMLGLIYSTISYSLTETSLKAFQSERREFYDNMMDALFETDDYFVFRKLIYPNPGFFGKWWFFVAFYTISFILFGIVVKIFDKCNDDVVIPIILFIIVAGPICCYLKEKVHKNERQKVRTQKILELEKCRKEKC